MTFDRRFFADLLLVTTTFYVDVTWVFPGLWPAAAMGVYSLLLFASKRRLWRAEALDFTMQVSTRR